MKPAKLVLVLAMVLVCSSSVLTQTAPNLENGWKPYGSYDGSHLDTVNLMNGNLMLHAPLLPDVPQRGITSLAETLYITSKDWQAVCGPNPAQGGATTCSWRRGGTGVQILIIPSLIVHRTLNKQYTGGEGITTYVAYGYSITSADASTHEMHGVVGSEDSNGAPTKFDSIDLSDYHLEMTNPDANGIRNNFTITDRHGNQYQGAISQTQPCGRAQDNGIHAPGHYAPMIDDSPMGDQYCSQTGYATLMIDSNGNQMNLRGLNSTTLDTMGRPAPLFVSGPAVDPTDSSGCSLAHPFVSSSVFYYKAPDGSLRSIKECVSQITVHTAFNQFWGGFPISEFDSMIETYPGETAVTTIILGDGTKWSFDYDNYGELAYVGLPTGGSITYTWTTISFVNCSGSITPVSRAVATRTLNDGQGHTYQWTYNWGAFANGTLTNRATDPLLNDTAHTFTAQVPQGAPFNGSCNLYETSSIAYQGSQSVNQPLQRVDTTYSSTGLAEDNFGSGGGVGNVFATDVVTTVYPSNKVKKLHKDPDAGLGTGLPIFGNVKKELEYDWGPGQPGPLLRETDTTYQWENNPAYLTAHLLDLPASVIVKDASGNRASETDYSYDEAAYLTTPNPAVTTQHVSPPYGVRGNQTTVSRWLNTSNSFISSHTNWYDTGEVAQAIDPLGHTTTYTYDPYYVGAYVTQTCSPTTSPGSVAHCVSGIYDFNTGVLTSLTNENATTQASGNTQGDAAHTSNYSYDSMFRITSGQAPPDPANSGARAQTGFNFSAPNAFPITVQRTKSITNALSDSATSSFDGLGRAYKGQHVLPNGTATVDTTFDLAGHTATVSNPYFTTSDPTYGITTNLYDALDRVTQTTKQDGSISSVKYNDSPAGVQGVCTTTTDEAGKQRRTCVNGLGRLVEVDEPSLSAPPLQNNHALMQTDGNLVLYTPGNTALWSTGTAGSGAGGFEVQDNGDVVLYIEKWQAGTYVPPSPGPFMAQGCNIGWALNAPQTLSPGQCLVSPHGQYRLGMEFDGNLVLYNLVNNVYTVTWNSATYNNPGAYAVMQTDGNFAVYSSGGVALWASGTSGTNSQRLELWDDGRFIIFRSAWNAGTAQGRWAGSMTHPGCDLGIGTGGGGWMGTGQCFVSPNGRYELILQTDGNLVLYDRSPTPAVALWSTGTAVTAISPGVAMQTLYTYDALGNLTCVEQHGDAASGTGCGAAPSNDATSPWRVRRFTYDSLSRMLTAKNPESGTITYLYDADGELLMKTSPAPNQTGSNTQPVSYCYDELHRPTKRDYLVHTFSPPACPITAPMVSYTYDSGANAKGHLVGMTDQAGTATYTYDILGRLATETRTIAGVSKNTSYTYNLDGSVKTLTYPSSRVVTFTPDSAGRLVSAVDGNGTNYVMSANYNPDGSLNGLLNGSTPALNQSFQYTPRLQLCRITTLTWGTLPTSCTDSQHIGNIMDRGYDFHAGNGTAGSGTDNGNVFAITNYRDATRSQAFTYDPLNRLTSGWSSANTGAYSWGENYTIDAWGSLQISPMDTKAHGGTFQLSGNVQNRPTGLAYDAAGNLMSYLSATYIYDQENRLSSTAGMTYTYDGNGDRVLKSNTSTGAAVKRYWSMGGNTLAEGDGSGNLTAEYIYFGSKRVARVDLPANTVHYYLSDHLGSTSIVASAAGAVEEESDYYPFGTEVVVTGGVNELKFTGKRRDTESQLDYFGARYYSNPLGRFITADLPFADQHLQNPQSWNLYMYAGNRPTSLIDTDGREVKEVVNPTVYYHVSGNTAGEAWNNAPKVSGLEDGNRGNTHTNIGVGPYKTSITSHSGPTETTVTEKVTSAEVDLTVTTTLPKWDGYAAASPEEQKEWDQLSSGLTDHENGHKEIAEKAANDLDKSLPGTTASGTGKKLAIAQKNAKDALSKKIEDKHKAAVRDNQAKTDKYDEKTQHGEHQERKNAPD